MKTEVPGYLTKKKSVLFSSKKKKNSSVGITGKIKAHIDIKSGSGHHYICQDTLYFERKSPFVNKNRKTICC